MVKTFKSERIGLVKRQEGRQHAKYGQQWFQVWKGEGGVMNGLGVGGSIRGELPPNGQHLTQHIRTKR